MRVTDGRMGRKRQMDKHRHSDRNFHLRTHFDDVRSPKPPNEMRETDRRTDADRRTNTNTRTKTVCNKMKTHLNEVRSPKAPKGMRETD